MFHFRLTLASWVNIYPFRETGKREKRGKRRCPALSAEDERQSVSTPFRKRRIQMRRMLGMAAMATVLWIGAANFAQGFS